ncbi:MAG TPA: TetR/AcrR family transcriptional regulator [Ferruginibacter sp.]|nr:TetR/AcrR family transcriptional regulator [Ferruginibacter sp.]HRE63567.1 TetR/AcrR family transcriptional regulator [Ferruginibacter sp.]
MAKIKSTTNGSKKEVIARKAAALFRQKGFNASSMRELAVVLGVEAPSLYNHIGSKVELLQLICFKIADAFAENLKVIEQLDAPIETKLEKFIRFHIHIIQVEFDEVYVANHEWKFLHEPWLTEFLNRRKLYEEKLLQLIKEAAASNVLRNIHPLAASLTILSAVRGLEFWHRNKAGLSAKELEENMVDHLLKGLIK